MTTDKLLQPSLLVYTAGLKAVARNLLTAAIARGNIKRPQACSQCGAVNSRIHGHHKDYNRPLSVIWLCASCHSAAHGEYPSKSKIAALKTPEHQRRKRKETIITRRIFLLTCRRCGTEWMLRRHSFTKGHKDSVVCPKCPPGTDRQRKEWAIAKARSNPYDVPVTYRLPHELVEAYKARADLENISDAEWLRQAIKEKLAKRRKENTVDA